MQQNQEVMPNWNQFNDNYEAMAELNQRMSLFTAFSTWKERFHNVNMDNEIYKNIFDDTCYLINQWGDGENPPDEVQDKLVKDIATRMFYILTTNPDETISLVTVASKLDADCQQLYEDYEENISAYAEMVYHTRSAGLFTYATTQNDHPVLTPTLAVKGELRTELDDKFASALPQVGDVVGEMDSKGWNLLPGVMFKGKSTRRKTPLNAQDRRIVSLVSRQRYKVDMDILHKMEYYVPTISENGEPISERQQEDARTAFYRFRDMADEAHHDNTVIQLPTTQDSRGRFYNMATDPAIRLSLRSPKYTGGLTEFELNLLTKETK